jgi:hypothetical protein
MTEQLLLVDYENVQALDVATIPKNVRVHVVLGAKQKSIVAKVEAKLKPLGDRASVNRIKTMAPNAVDFCIAYYLGEELAQRPDTGCIILSKDKKGFDPLVLHLTKERRRQVRRVNSQREAFPAPAKPAKKKVVAATAVAGTLPDNYARLLKLLRKDKTLPLKRKGLAGKLKSWLQKLPAEARAALERRLFGDGLVREADGTLTFSLKRTNPVVGK